MEQQKYEHCLNAASKIYNYYYTLAIKEFESSVANILAKIPADYVFNKLMETYPNCYINNECCLEYCNDMLDFEFDRLSPEFKRNLYDKAFNINSSISDSEINLQLKSKRRKVKNLFFDEVRNFKSQQENDLSQLLQTIQINPQRKRKSVDTLLKELKLN
jgi:hypothetical protein